MDIRSFFTKQEVAEMMTTYEKWHAFFQDQQTPDKAVDSMYHDHAIRAYLLGHHATAIEGFRRAVESGFPPGAYQDNGTEFSRQWANFQDGISAMPLGLAAYLVGDRDRAKEILTWCAVRLCDTDLVVADQDGPAAGAAIYRTYAMLALGQPWLKADADLDLGLQKIRDYSDFQHEWGLPITLGALVLCRRGEISRSEATDYLKKLIQNAKRETYDKQLACFHALYLQSAFPDVFDPVLPLLVAW